MTDSNLLAELQYVLDLLHRAKQDGKAIVLFPDGTISVLGDIKKTENNPHTGKFSLKAKAATTVKMTVPGTPVLPLYAEGSWVQFGKSGKVLHDKSRVKEIKEMREQGERIWAYLLSENDNPTPDHSKKFRYTNIGMFNLSDGDTLFVELKSKKVIEYLHDGIAWFDSVTAENEAARPGKVVFRETSANPKNPEYYKHEESIVKQAELSNDLKAMFKNLRDLGAFVTANPLEEALKDYKAKIHIGFIHTPTNTVVLWPDIVKDNYTRWEYGDKVKTAAEWELRVFMGQVIPVQTF
jgi:hypothetical protein